MAKLTNKIQHIYDLLDNVETLISETSIEEIERNLLILMGIFDVELEKHSGDWESFRGPWCLPFSSHLELAFYKGEFFSESFVKYYEIWFHRDDNPARIVEGSRLNDFCLSKSVYSKIKKNKHLFKEFAILDCTDLWESAVFLFERYDCQSFSRERYERVLG